MNNPTKARASCEGREGNTPHCAGMVAGKWKRRSDWGSIPPCGTIDDL